MEIQITTENLLSLLQERNASLNFIRDKVQNVSFRILGILLGVSGRIIQQNILFPCDKKLLILIVIISSFFIIYRYFNSLKRGAITQLNIICELEKRIGLYQGEDSIYPKKWNKKHVDRPFLDKNYELIYFGYIITLLTIILFT